MNRSELNSMTRAKLIDFGRKKKIEVTTSMTKAELVTAVAKGLKQLEKKKTPSPKPKAVSKKGSKKAAVQKKTTKKKTAAKKKSTIKTKVKSGARTAAKKKKSAVKKVLPSASRAHKKTSKKHHAALATHRKPAAGKTKSPSSQWVHSQNVEEDLAAKFILGQPEIHDEAEHEVRVDLPAGYGDHRLVLMPRDPYWAHCYWELQTPEVEASRRQLNRGWDELRWVLRAHVRSAKLERYFDTDIDISANNGYLHLAAPGATCRVQLGLLDRDGYFAVVVESNTITLPADAPSDNLDEHWMLTDEELRHHYVGVAGSESDTARDRSSASWVSGEHHVSGSVHLQTAPRKK